MKLFATISLLFAATAFAQNSSHVEVTKPHRFYKLQVRVDQLDGTRLVKSQEESITVPLGTQFTHIRSGEKIPFLVQGAPQYQDVGLNVDCTSVEEEASSLSLRLKVELSAAVSEETGKLPVLRQYSWDSNVLVPVGKSATVYSDSDSSPQYKMEVKVTATPLELH